jgi:hypothetical protein
MYIAGRPGWQPAAHVNRTPQERRRGDSAAPDGTS